MNFMAKIVLFFVVAVIGELAIAQNKASLTINQLLWAEFSQSERATLIAKFPNLELIPSESVGIIQSVQAVNRSTAGTNSGAALGGALAQTMYIDKAFSGSGNNYSATTQLGAGLLGALLGSSLDSSPTSRFLFNYGIRTLDGQIKEVRVESGDEFTRPVGQCVTLPGVVPAPVGHCAIDKLQFLKKLSAISQAPEGAVVSNELTGINVNCRVPGVGLMTLEKNSCLQMEGTVEK
jgi:outer membrane lipoprotein SlyB